MPISLILISSETGKVNDVYKNLKSMREINETKMTVGSHDVIAVSKVEKENTDPEKLHQKIKNQQGVKNITSINEVTDDFLKNLAK